MDPKKAIWKFDLSIENCGQTQEVDMPDGATILSAINQHDKLVVYALVQVDRPVAKRKFKVYMTGQTFKTDVNHSFVGTVAFGGGEFVVHVFETNKW